MKDSNTNLVNLTPHTISLIADSRFDGGKVEWIIPASGQVARCAEVYDQAPLPGVDLPLVLARYGAVADLPPPKPGTIYIVSAMVRLAVPKRGDVVSPGEQIRDKDGKVIGCKSLIRNNVPQPGDHDYAPCVCEHCTAAGYKTHE